MQLNYVRRIGGVPPTLQSVGYTAASIKPILMSVSNIDDSARIEEGLTTEPRRKGC